MQFLKADTAIKVVVGPFVDVGDGFTPETAVTLTGGGDNADEAELLKHDNATTVDISSNTWAALTGVDGYYHLTLTAGNLDTEGQLTVVINNDSVHLPVKAQFMVVNANVYDSLFAAAATDYLQVDAIQVSGDATAADNLELDYDGTGYTKTNSTIGTATAVTNDVGITATAVDNIWDEVLTGATHNVANSAGRRLRQLETGVVLHAGTADAGASNTIDLETGVASSTDDFYNHNLVVTTGGTGAGQVRVIVDYDGTGQQAKVSPPWVTNPDATTTYDIISGYCHAETNSKTITSGLAAAGAAGSITLDSDASATDSYYVNDVVIIDSGTGEGQERIITAYNGTTKVATIEPNWTTNPDTTSNYLIEEALSVADIFAVSNDATAADNLELDYDGTGYAKANSTIGTCTTNTDMRGTDSAATAADLATVDANVDAILVDTGTTLDGKIDTIDANVDAILVDTGTTLDGKINTIDTNVDAILVDTGTTIPGTITTLQADTDDIQTRLPAALVGGRMDSNTSAINNSNAAAVRMALAAAQMTPGTVDNTAHTPTTTEFEADDITEATADHFNNRLLYFTSGVLQGQYTDITDYALTGGRGHFTVTALTEAPANNVTFIIL
jgi:hypothetical protein